MRTPANDSNAASNSNPSPRLVRGMVDRLVRVTRSRRDSVCPYLSSCNISTNPADRQPGQCTNCSDDVIEGLFTIIACRFNRAASATSWLQVGQSYPVAVTYGVMIADGNIIPFEGFHGDAPVADPIPFGRSLIRGNYHGAYSIELLT